MELTVTSSNIRRWIMGANIYGIHTSDKHSLRVYKWFHSILLDDGKTFPTQQVSLESNHTKKQVFTDFIMRLLYFWSGSNRLSTTHHYKIGITMSGYPKSQASTLYLPRDAVSKEDLYTKLIVATFNITEGKSLYGGYFKA